MRTNPIDRLKRKRAEIAAVLPQPLVIGRLRYWRRGAIRRYLAEVDGEPAPAPQPDDENLLQAKELRHMLGGVSDMWIWRHSPRPAESPVSATA